MAGSSSSDTRALLSMILCANPLWTETSLACAVASLARRRAERWRQDRGWRREDTEEEEDAFAADGEAEEGGGVVGADGEEASIETLKPKFKFFFQLWL